MKEVIAIIRGNKINQTKQALVDAGFSSFTGIKVMGRGKGIVDTAALEALGENPGMESEVLASLAQGPRLYPKRMLFFAVPDDQAADLVQTLIKVNRTNKAGDGKIFVRSLMDSVRVRTGETGDSAIA